MAKRKRSTKVTTTTNVTSARSAPASTRRTSPRNASIAVSARIDTVPDSLCPSPDAEGPEVDNVKSKKARTGKEVVGELSETLPASTVHVKASPKGGDGLDQEDPEAEGDVEANPEELKEALSRPPPVNSSYLPLPWKGRLGYACLNTYLRAANPPVFSSRTCRIASILEHRHPLKDPTQPEHPTKNRPDKDQPADIARGQEYVEALGLANARDIVKMLRWNDRYGIKFLRLSSEMFPFASHDVYGYKLAPFASEVLAEAGRVAAELGHRLTTHPGQFTQLGSPRKEVIQASIRDLEYHCEMLDLLELPPQLNRDAVMILHMGGVFGDKAVTIARFKENYVKLRQGIKDRLVLENDDVSYSVHDLLPVCEELNIPLVLDFHHHNIVFDGDKVREGTLDIMDLYDRITATWTRKGITQKMHYSEPVPSAITARQRRKHNPRPATLPPCPPDMDLMIEAKDKEQAVFELMRTFKLPRFDTFNDMTPYVRNDENKAWKPPRKKKSPRKKRLIKDDEEELVGNDEGADGEVSPLSLISESEISMGGPDRRVYWPPGMEEWLRPKKRDVKPRDPAKAKTTAEPAALRRAEKAAWQAAREASAEADTPGSAAHANTSEIVNTNATPGTTPNLAKAKSVYGAVKAKKGKPVRAPHLGRSVKNKKNANTPVLTPSPSDQELYLDDKGGKEEQDFEMPDLTDGEEVAPVVTTVNRRALTRTLSGRSAKRKAAKYAEGDDDDAG
ncbi:UV damage endonuclease UvdE [Cladophialophora bantiana CBS 173.52]|uniref:UV damage endonuclease UvdE n=1 Tax=Cladophialophora bantiana (strain ATCC 10958 / CBS 173.52 / CDC B-1940 / NIH 8579) TaxID=1442370 RepID=A0A0D2I4J5_CLAB1|nr:UV damage endonuclease UvdE [Cladophialophora bantiana CBS 173.52]KIW98190.1 UV damage endonuclease UvdE [Cladophialophora bantiana CBS 173.52]